MGKRQRSSNGEGVRSIWCRITWDPTKPRNGQWDMGHIPEEKYSKMHQLYMDDVISKEEFLDWFRNPANYRPELPSTNRGHQYE